MDLRSGWANEQPMSPGSSLKELRHTHTAGEHTQKPKDIQQPLAKAHTTITCTKCHSHMWLMVNLQGAYRNCSTKGRRDPLTTVWKKPGESLPNRHWRTMREHHRQPSTHKFNNLEKMDEFLEKCKLPKLPYSRSWIRSYKFPAEKTPHADGSTGDNCQTFKGQKKMTPILENLSKNV